MERSYLPTPFGDLSYLERKGVFPIVFLHGLGGSGNNWLKLAQYLPGKYHLLMPDLLGHGKSTRPVKDYSIAEQVEVLKFFVREKNLAEYALVGNSYGGWVSMRFCAAGGKPAYLILVDSAGINPTVGEFSKEGEDAFVQRVMAMNPRNDPEVISRFVRMNATGSEKLTPEELKSLPEKTLIIWGRKDRLIPVKYAEELHRRIGGSELKILEEGGHIPHSTNPEEVAWLISDFVRVQ